MSNIINVRFTDGVMAVTEPQYQYNYGQILKIDGVELPTAYLVHFSNERLGSSITVIGNADGVKIPEQFFETCKNIYAWVYLHEGLEDGETVYLVIIPIKARAAITDEEPTPEEQSTISQIIEALNDAVDKAEDAVTKYPTIVEGYWYVWDAVNEQWLSTNVKATGEQGIQGLKGLKGDKGLDYVLTAADKVEIAEIVEDDVNNAVYNVYPNDKVSGTIATFVDGADDIPLKSLVVSVEPEQDLHGYEKPWIGGTGKNLLNNLLLKDQTGWNIIELQLKPNTTYVMSSDSDVSSLPIYFIINDEAQGSSTKVTSSHSVIRTTGEVVNAKVVQRRSSGDDSFANYHYQVEEGTTATAYEPYENICPITGWSKTIVQHHNENLWRDLFYSIGNYMSLITDENDTYYGYYSGSVENWNTASKREIGRYMPHGIPKVTMSGDAGCRYSSTFTFRFTVMYLSGSTGYGGNLSVDKNQKKRISKTLTSASGITGWWVNTSAGYSNMSGAIKNIMVSLSNSTEYVPPKVETIECNWENEAGIVYGAKIDIVSGLLTIEKAVVTLDGSQPIGNVNWRPLSNSVGWLYAPSVTDGILNLTLDDSNYQSYGMLCDSLPVRPYTGTDTIYSNDASAISIVGSDAYAIAVRVKDTSLTTKEAINTYLQNNPITVVYPLANPIEIQLDAQEIKSFIGENNMWADTGAIEVLYRADVNLYVDKKIQEAISALS